MLSFVKEKNSEETALDQKNQIEEGSNVRREYENILQLPSTSTKRRPKHFSKRKKRPQLIDFDKNKFFKAVSSNNIDELNRMNINQHNVNVTDQLDWTALMMASCEGYLNIVKFLIQHGAQRNHFDKRNNSAITLAKKRKHDDIYEYLQRLENSNQVICLSSDDEIDNNQSKQNTFYCDDCQSYFNETDEKSHKLSILHRFNDKNGHKFTARHFGIPDTNVGFRMLMQQGWDRESGLGNDKNGILFPIKTTLRKTRSGLGSKQSSKARVTHFQAFDQNAIKANPKSTSSMQIVKTKRQIRAEKRRHQRKDRRLRKLLS